MAALTTLNVMQEEGLLANAERVGSHLKTRFTEALQGVAGVVDIRGMGLMMGIELDRPCGELVKRALVTCPSQSVGGVEARQRMLTLTTRRAPTGGAARWIAPSTQTACWLLRPGLLFKPSQNR